MGDGEIETSGAEKILAVVLAVFIAIGAIWGYVKLDEVAKSDSTCLCAGPEAHRLRGILGDPERTGRRSVRSKGLGGSGGRPLAAWSSAARRIEPHWTPMNRRPSCGRSTSPLRPGSRLLREGWGRRHGRGADSSECGAGTGTAERAASSAPRSSEDEDRAQHDRIVFLLRLALLILMLAAAYRLLIRLRSRHSRYLPAALAWIGATAILAVVMAADYTDNYIEFADVGPLAISIAGIALTLVAFVALQRFLAKRVPARRVRRGECPFCGSPFAKSRIARGAGER